MPLDGTIGGLVGMLEVLRVECPTCGRQGRYNVARLVAVFGPRARLTDWLSLLTSDCPRKNQKGVTRACGAVMPDLSRLRDEK
jgi:hypothetical protein